MTPTGVFMMVLSYTVVISLIVFCFYRVFTTPHAEEIEHGPLDIDTRDTENPNGE